MCMSSYCTNSVDYKKFRPHGRVNLSIITDEIIVFRALGPFNLELLSALDEIESNVVKNLKSKSWVEIVVFEYSCLSSLDVFKEFTSHLISQKKNNLSPLASAFVFPKEVEGTLLMASQYKKCFDEASLEYKEFDNETEAMAWVKTFI